MGGSVPRYNTRKKGGCIGRKQESIIESWAWHLHLCIWQSTNFVFCLVIYWRDWQADTWPGESNLLCFLFSATVTKTGGWTTSLKYDIGTKVTKLNLRNQILCKAAGLNWLPAWGKGVCSDSNRTAEQLQIAVRKSLEKWCQAWFWIDTNQSLQPNWSQMKWDVWKQCSDQRWQNELQFSIWRFF